MDDLISKLSEIRSKYNCLDEAEEPYYRALSEAIKKLSEPKASNPLQDLPTSPLLARKMPSAQPKQQHGRVFQGIVVEYPSYNTYPEYEGKPYFSIKYTENGQEFIGYGTYKPEVLSEWLKEYFMPSAQPEQQWIPCSERLPDKKDDYLCSYNWCAVADICEYDPDRNEWGFFYDGGWKVVSNVIAWMPLPEPYKAERLEE